MFGALCGVVRDDVWPDTSTGLIRAFTWEMELALTFFLTAVGLAQMETLEGGNMLVESAGPWAGGDTESPLQNDWDPIAIPLSGELFLLLLEGLEVAGSRVEFDGERWEGGMDGGFAELCSDCTGLWNGREAFIMSSSTYLQTHLYVHVCDRSCCGWKRMYQTS